MHCILKQPKTKLCKAAFANIHLSMLMLHGSDVVKTPLDTVMEVSIVIMASVPSIILTVEPSHDSKGYVSDEGVQPMIRCQALLGYWTPGQLGGRLPQDECRECVLARHHGNSHEFESWRAKPMWDIP